MKRNHGSTDVVNEEINQAAPLHISEIGNQGGIEPVSENDFVSVAEKENFMNEVLTIVVHQDNQEGSLDVVNPGVNGMNQPLIRGAKQKCKRKYVEVLARSRVTSYTQRQRDANDPGSIQMIPRTVLTYPFTVVFDPNPNGPAWLEAILREE